jgi:hypothetical protein
VHWLELQGMHKSADQHYTAETHAGLIGTNLGIRQLMCKANIPASFVKE